MLAICFPMLSRPGLLIASTLLLGACFVDHGTALPEDFSTCEIANEVSAEVPDGTLTYYEHIKPIVDAKCVGCHETGGIAPFALETYMDLFVFKDSVAASVESGAMPPWQPDPCCSEYKWDRSLSKAEKQMMATWNAQGAQPGAPEDEGAPIDFDRSALSRVDISLSMPEPYEPEPQIGDDDFRCFLIDWPHEDTKYVTGLNVVPSNPSVVHHVIIYVIDEDAAEKLESKEGKDGRPGYNCFGELGTIPEGAVGGWEPASLGFDYPEGLGRKIKKGSKILLNVHYDLANREPGPDQMRIDMALADEVDRELKGLGVANPQWIIGDGMAIEAGDADAMYNFSYDPTVIFGKKKPVEVFGVNIHMHELGASASLAVKRKDGSFECLLNIREFDFEWNGEYFLERPVTINPGDELYVECHFDNSAANQKPINGEYPAPIDIGWGPNEEMCAGILLMSEVE